MSYMEKELQDIIESLRKDLSNSTDENEKYMLEEKILSYEATIENIQLKD